MDCECVSLIINKELRLLSLDELYQAHARLYSALHHSTDFKVGENQEEPAAAVEHVRIPTRGHHVCPELVPSNAWGMRHRPSIPADLWGTVWEAELLRAGKVCEGCGAHDKMADNHLVLHQRWKREFLVSRCCVGPVTTCDTGAGAQSRVAGAARHFST